MTTTTHDPIDDLTVAELDEANRRLKADALTAITEGTVDRWQAMAIVAWLIARRDDPKAQLETFRAMRPAELADQLGMGDDDKEAADDPAANPTDSPAEPS